MMLPADLLGAALVGMAAGTLHFLGLRRVVGWMLQGRAVAALLLQALRLAVLAFLLLPVARLGAPALLAALAGILAARTVLLRWWRPA